MPKTPRGLALVDSTTGGQVTLRLIAWREAGVSNPAIARLLQAEFGISVTSETVRRWLLTLPNPDNGEGAAA